MRMQGIEARSEVLFYRNYKNVYLTSLGEKWRKNLYL